MAEIEFTCYGDFHGQGRPRFKVVNGHAMAYDPKTSKEDKKYIRQMASMNRPHKPIEGAISLNLTIYRRMTKQLSESKQKRQKALSGEIRPVTKPDIDNKVKLVLDALNGLIFKDDNQIVELTAKEFYGEEPRIEISIKELDEVI